MTPAKSNEKIVDVISQIVNLEFMRIYLEIREA